MVGSAGFMAPEQVTGRAGQAADIFAWAVTLTYAATGEMPFGTGSSDAILYRILHTEPDTASVPELLRPLVEAALIKDPQCRPRAGELLNRLTKRTGANCDYGPTLRLFWPRSGLGRSRSSLTSRCLRMDPCRSGLLNGAPAAEERGGCSRWTAMVGLGRDQPLLLLQWSSRGSTCGVGNDDHGWTWLHRPGRAAHCVGPLCAVGGDRRRPCGRPEPGKMKAGEPVLFAELSTDGGASREEPLFCRSVLGLLLLCWPLGSGGFTAATRSGRPGWEDAQDLTLRHLVLIGFHLGQRPRRRRKIRCAAGAGPHRPGREAASVRPLDGAGASSLLLWAWLLVSRVPAGCDDVL